jgi:hypothetical protein
MPCCSVATSVSAGESNWLRPHPATRNLEFGSSRETKAPMIAVD